MNSDGIVKDFIQHAFQYSLEGLLSFNSFYFTIFGN
jgi:hypothetical protein